MPAKRILFAEPISDHDLFFPMRRGEGENRRLSLVILTAHR